MSVFCERRWGARESASSTPPNTHTQGREHTHTHQIFLEAAPNGVYKWYEEQFGFERVGAIPMVRL